MTWELCAFIFLAVIAVSFLFAFIEVWWKSRNDYFFGKAKPRSNDPK